MKTRTFETTVQIFSLEELTSEDRELCNAALIAADDAYAIYSHFHVGAAVKMENGEIILHFIKSMKNNTAVCVIT